VVTQVCRHWRKIARSTPALWSDIDSYSVTLSLESLEHSAESDVSVYIRDALRDSSVSQLLDSERFIKTVASHSRRFKQLHIQPALTSASRIANFFHHPAPKLRASTIMLNLAEEGPHELPVLFDGRIPNLQVLTLANFTRWWPGQFGTKLTHLCLMKQPFSARVSTDQFLEFLSACGSLEELVLVDAGPSTLNTPTGSKNARRPVSLPRLRSLQIGDWPRSHKVAKFLENISLPQTARLFIWDEDITVRGRLFSTLLPTNLRHLRPLHEPTALHLIHPPAIEENGNLFSVQNGVLVFLLNSTLPTQGLLHSVFLQLYLGTIEELTICFRSDPELPEAIWRDIFTKMPQLHTLSILWRPSRTILNALNAKNTSGNMLCPALSWLTVTDDYPVSSIALFLLADERARQGIPLRRLHILNKKFLYSDHLQDELENLRTKITEVEYRTGELIGENFRFVGWPTAAYKWVLDMETRKARY
jgi:hypothetical protein